MNLMPFCSLGLDCEFGLFQRHVGSEPIDLLRWANTPEPALFAMLSDRFARIADNTILEQLDPVEYMIFNKAYDIYRHTWISRDKLSDEVVLAREAQRMAYLAGKLLDELQENSRVFVRSKGTEDPYLLHAALEKFGGKPTLLFVTDGVAQVDVEVLNPRLIHGKLPKFGETEDLIGTLPVDDWMALCQKVIDHLGLEKSLDIPGGV